MSTIIDTPRHWFLVLTLTATAAGGCSDSASGTCTRDPSLIAQKRACVADEDCPCGAGCELGACKASCTDDTSCSGGTCDRFGRCRASGDNAAIPALVAPALRQIELSPSTLRSIDPSAAQPVHVRVLKGTTGELRVASDSGLELRCDTAGSFQSECRVPSVSAGQDVVVWVRPAGGKKLAAPLQVRAYFGNQLTATSVSSEDTSSTATGALRAGKYSGNLTLIAAGVADDPTAAGQPFDDIAIPIDASVYLTGGALVLEDPLKVLASTGTWIGRLTPKGDSAGVVDFPTIPYLSGELTSGESNEVLLDAPEASYSATGNSITFELVTRFEGVLMGLRRPQARWRVSLSRSGDLAAGAVAPAIPADTAPTLAASRGLSPTAWEAAVAKAATPDPSRVLGLSDKEKRAFLDVFGRKGTSGSLEVCNLSSSTVGVLAQLAVKDSWGTEPAGGTGWVAPATLAGSGLPVVSKLASALSDRTSISISAQIASTTSVSSMPCKASFSSTSVTFTGACGAAEQATFNLGQIDLCTQMAAAYGCQVVDVTTSPAITIGASISTKDASSCTRSNAAITIAGTVSRVCRLPVVPASCAELALCYEKPTTVAGTTPESVVGTYLDGGSTLPLSGDAKCVSGKRSAAIEADVNAELPASDLARLTTTALQKECDTDLAAIRKKAPGTLKAYGDGIDQAFVSAKCLQAARVLYAIGLATDADRRRAIGADAPIAPIGSALGNRLIQRWLIHHAYLAREAAETERMSEVLRDSTEAKGLSMPSVDESLTSSLAGWQLLLHPRFASGVDQLPASVLVDPDYRQLLTTTAVPRQPYHEQPAALPVAMLDTIFAQLSLVEPGLERAALNRDATGIQLLSRTLRHLLIVRALASELAAAVAAHVKAQSLSEPTWMARYRTLASSTRGLVGRLIGQARAVQRGENALGIADDDTPLYFFGDEKSATRRFSAISDYLIGAGPGATTWAPTLVQRATDSLKAARTAWLSKRDRAVQVMQSQAELDSRLDKIRQTYGEQLATLCGKPDGLTSSQLLEKWTTFNEHTCAFRSDSATCSVDVDAYAKLMTADQVAYQLCVVKELRKASGDVQFVDDGLNKIVDQLDQCPKPTFPVACTDGTQRCVTCQTLSASVTPGSFRQLIGLSSLEDNVVQAARDLCAAKNPGVDTSLPGPDDVAKSPAGQAACFSGSIGEAVFEIRSTVDDLEIARSELADLKEAYAIAMSGCILQKVSADKQDAASAPFQTTLTALSSLKLAADIAATVVENAKDCASECFDVETWATGGAKAATICVMIGAQTVAQVTSTSLEFSMEQVKQASDNAVAAITKWASDKKCVDDATQKMVGINTAALRIRRALTDVDKATYRLSERKTTARRVYDDGRAALTAAQGRLVTPLTHDLWLDEGIKGFLRDLRLARRIMYLAVRAVGYETQQSLALESTVLTATTPAQLQAVLDQLWTSAATRGVGGKRPSDLKVVLSLRQNLLQLADRRDYSTGEQTLSDVERFRLLLRSPKYALFEDGVYKGQRIPFDIVPLGKLGVGQTMGIPVLTGADCAERLWSVNASILGASGLYRGSSPPTFTRIDLLKQNTFYSQWCTTPSATAPTYQEAAVRPSQNLFQDPVYGGELASGLGPKSEAQQYTRARIQAYFNVDRTTFEGDSYANGETSELAARGLYGSYALFIPAETLSLDGGNGLALNEVDDVLLRLNYVSVAR
jgi:hypothetical protein